MKSILPSPLALTLGVGSLWAAGCGGGDVEPTEDPLPPNVILISLDTLRYDHCSFNGYERETTPFLSRLAKESIVFDRAYTTMSWTLIAHMSMLTGMYPHQHGVMAADLALHPDVPTLAQRLRAESYDTHGVHFPGWLDAHFGFDRGFQSYDSASDIQLAGIEVERDLAALRPGFPYFLFVHLFDIHSGDLTKPGAFMYDPPEPFGTMFLEDARERLKDIDAKAWWDKPAPAYPEHTEAVTAMYDGGIRYVDSVLEAWFTDWEERGLLENTLVIITSDHGEGLRQRIPRFGGHGGMYQEGLRVPLIVRLPDGSRAGERIDGLTSHVDILPTVLEVLNLPADDRLPGRSLLGPERADDAWVFGQRVDTMVAVSRKHRLRFTHKGLQHAFDLEADPEEKKPITKRSDRELFTSVVVPLFEAALAEYGTFFIPPAATNVGDMDEAARNELKGLGYGAAFDK